MKTIDEIYDDINILAENIDKYEYGLPFEDKKIKQYLKEVILEAIKEDRKNVAEHAEVNFDNVQDYYSASEFKVDKESIINCPQIELK